MPKRALEGRSTKRRRPAKVPRNDDLSLQAEPVSDEPVSRAEPVSSDAINYDLLAAAILRQSQTLSQNQTNSSDTTMEILQPCVQNQGDIDAHAHPMTSQQTTTSTVSDNQPQQNIADLVRYYNKTVKEAFQETPHLHRQQTNIPVDLLYI